MTELIDSHCHLNYDFAPKTAADLVSEARAAGVSTLVTIGTDLPSIQAVAAISDAHPEVFHTVGVHPHEASTLADADLALLERSARHPKCRAIGEIGLDYHYDHSPREIQRARLEQQLELAVTLAQPIVIHSREGEGDLLEALRRYVPRARGAAVPGIIHCFTGTVEFGRACVDLGFLISFSGILTFKNAEGVREAARAFPLASLLVETDSPYLAPIPHRGRKCEPSMVRLTAQKLAEVKGTSLEEVAAVTSSNARKVFRITA
jgi:TatD DNase family protein